MKTATITDQAGRAPNRTTRRAERMSGERGEAHKASVLRIGHGAGLAVPPVGEVRRNVQFTPTGTASARSGRLAVP